MAPASLCQTSHTTCVKLKQHTPTTRTATLLRVWQAEIEVDLSAIRHNVARLRAGTGAEVMAVVKADGYGHGMVPVARAALDAGATWLGVCTLGEALGLR